MLRIILIGTLTAALVVCAPSPAAADLTAFWGFSPTPATRSARGFGIGLSLIVVGFEFEYSSTSEDAAELAPSLKTGMINGLIQTPTHTQLYLTAGGGFFRERLGDEGETSFGTNIGGGMKIGLAGPIRLRLDYRVFALRGRPLHKHPQRFYGGLNLSF
jgi:hypothetical protein